MVVSQHILEQSKKNKREHDCVLFTLCFSQGCFLSGKQSADAVNCLLTWAFNTTEGIGWAGDSWGCRQVYIKKNALISFFAEGGEFDVKVLGGTTMKSR